jgi:5-methylcytosine-specific restriction enzyme A
MRSMRPCSWPGCGELTRERHCLQHAATFQAERDRYRGSAHQRGYSARWRRLRADVLTSEPLCRYCARDGKVRAATVVDHIVPHKGNAGLMWARSNLQPLCARCHNSAKQREERTP